MSSSRGKQRVRELERRKVWAGGGNEGWWCGGYRGPLTWVVNSNDPPPSGDGGKLTSEQTS